MSDYLIQKYGTAVQELVRQMAGQVDIVRVDGKSLKTVTDNQLVPGSFLEREPDFIISPDGEAALPIEIIQVPEQRTAGGIIVQPEHLEKKWVIIQGATCRECGSREEMQGWDLYAPPHYPNRIVQCQECGAFNWMHRGKEEEIGG